MQIHICVVLIPTDQGVVKSPPEALITDLKVLNYATLGTSGCKKEAAG